MTILTPAVLLTHFTAEAYTLEQKSQTMQNPAARSGLGLLEYSCFIVSPALRLSCPVLTHHLMH